MSFIFGRRINLQLGKNFVEILLNRPLRQRQSLRNLPVRMACRSQLCYLQLLFRQLLQACFGKACGQNLPPSCLQLLPQVQRRCCQLCVFTLRLLLQIRTQQRYVLCQRQHQLVHCRHCQCLLQRSAAARYIASAGKSRRSLHLQIQQA